MRYLLIILVLLTTACNGNVRDFVGISREGPDEFKVRTFKPLEVPKQFVLKTPEAIIEYKQAVHNANAHNQKAMGMQKTGISLSSGESSFLKKVGSSDTANIRSVIDGENEQQKTEEKNFLDKVIYWNEEEDVNHAVDIAEELERLKKQKINTNSRVPNT